MLQQIRDYWAKLGIAEILHLSPPMMFVLRLFAASSLALWVSDVLMLENPSSSVTTVMIVSNPDVAAIVSKSLWRIFGTLVGVTVAVFMMAFFGQAPLLFDLALAVWLGISCCAATLLRYFRAYGAVLAGYTVSIVSLTGGVLSNPDNIFDSAMARLSVVVIGICSAGLVFMLTTPIPSRKLVEQQFTNLLHTMGRLLLEDVETITRGEPIRHRYGQLSALAARLDQTVDYVATTDHDVKLMVQKYRRAASELMTILSAFMVYVAINENGAANTLQQRTNAIMREVFRSMTEVESLSPATLHKWLAFLAEYRDEVQSLKNSSADLRDVSVLDEIKIIIMALEDAMRVFLPSHDRRSLATDFLFPAYIDWPTAVQNGMRGFFAVILTSLVWYITYWPSAPMMLICIIPGSALLATMPSAGLAAVGMAKGAILAVVASFFAKYGILVQVDGFPLMMLCCFLFVAPVAYMSQKNPLKWAAVAPGYMIFFWPLVAPNNPISYSMTSWTNAALAYCVGAIGLVLVFRVLFPPSPFYESYRLLMLMWRSTQRTWRRRRLPLIWSWTHVQQLKLYRLLMRMQHLNPKAQEALSIHAIGLIIMGRVALRLREELESPHLSLPVREVAQKAFEYFHEIPHDPLKVSKIFHEGASTIRNLLYEAGQGESVAGVRSGMDIAAQLNIMSHVTERCAVYLTPRERDMHFMRLNGM